MPYLRVEPAAIVTAAALTAAAAFVLLHKGAGYAEGYVEGVSNRNRLRAIPSRRVL